MGTRAAIIAKTDVNTYKVITVNWDGYLDHVGAMLLMHYNTQERVEELLELGHLSTLHEECTKPEGHSFNTPVEGYCVAYGRDRGETDQEADIYLCTTEDNFRDMLASYILDDCNIIYVWESPGWDVFTENGLIPLENVCVNHII